MDANFKATFSTSLLTSVSIWNKSRTHRKPFRVRPLSRRQSQTPVAFLKNKHHSSIPLVRRGLNFAPERINSHDHSHGSSFRFKRKILHTAGSNHLNASLTF